MITLAVWCIANGFFFHYDASIIAEEAKMIIVTICVASDLNLLATLFSGK